VPWKGEPRECGWIKLRWVGDGVVSVFMHWTEHRVHTGFPVMMPAMPSNIGACVALAISTILRNDYTVWPLEFDESVARESCTLAAVLITTSGETMCCQ